MLLSNLVQAFEQGGLGESLGVWFFFFFDQFVTFFYLFNWLGGFCVFFFVYLVFLLLSQIWIIYLKLSRFSFLNFPLFFYPWNQTVFTFSKCPNRSSEIIGEPRGSFCTIVQNFVCPEEYFVKNSEG